MLKDHVIEQLQSQGVTILDPTSIYIGEDVNLTQIKGPNTIIYPGTRLSGSSLCILAGSVIGKEGPVTIENCVLAKNVELKAGYFAGSTFLDRSNVGLGAHIRPGTIFEEEANAAHTVGLKQTVLLPFVTLGSLINFCDILMAGGTSRQDHSEVGSSFIHFNFTPYGQRGDKATASLIGDIPRGVMLNEKRIFLGGQAGLVGPIHIDYGTVLAAGTVYRQDHGPNQLVVGEALPVMNLPFTPNKLNRIADKVERNLKYIGNLVALYHFYRDIRLAYADEELKPIYQFTMDRCLKKNIEERIKQLGRIASYMPASIKELEANPKKQKEVNDQKNFEKQWPTLEERLGEYETLKIDTLDDFERFKAAYQIKRQSLEHIEAIQALDEKYSLAGTLWLNKIVDQIVGLYQK